jgi:hypothetical protein
MNQLRSSVALVEFAYASRAAPGMPAATMLRIAGQSWRFNRTAGITGLLRFDRGRFRQIIEGPGDVVLPLSSRVLADGRHGDIEIEVFGPIADRRFDAWTIEGFNELAAPAAPYAEARRFRAPCCVFSESGACVCGCAEPRRAASPA